MLLVNSYNEATNQYHIDLTDSFYKLTYSDCIDNINNCIWQLHKEVESNCYVVDSSSFNKFHTCWNYNETGIVNKSSEGIDKLASDV